MKYLSILFLAVVILSSCKKDEEGLCTGTECNYTLGAGETAGNVAAGLDGEHNLTAQYATATSPFANGTTGKFTLDGNVLTVEISGETCITLHNPIHSTFAEVIFVDDCRDNLKYAVSESSQGGLNEVNVGSMTGTFYAQFH